MRITKGLIIADPWIGYILDGTKDWEMRSSSASHRGWFGLIRKGTGLVYGVARLIEVGAPLSPSDMIVTFGHHRIPEHMIRSGEVAKWNTPWKLADVLRLVRQVPYRHKSGAVTWVELDPAAVEGIARQVGVAVPTANPGVPMSMAGASGQDQASTTADTMKVDVSQRGQKLYVKQVDRKSDRLAAALPPPPPSPTHTARPLTPPVWAAARTATGRVIGEVEITEGNIAHSHIYLRSIFDRFPADAIGGSNKATRAKRDLTIEWGGAEPVQTDLDGEKKLFRSRSWVSAFYQLHRARAGDRVLIEEIATYRYRVSMKKTGSVRETS